MLGLIKQSEVVEQACQQFLQSHPCFYSFGREVLPLTTPHGNLYLEEQEVTTQVRLRGQEIGNRVTLHLIRNAKNGENCIVYLHGLASYCLEGKFLIPYLANSFSLCLFDSRSHGKNNAPFVTYGLLEAQDLLEIIRALVGRGFKRIILWGRSMGAVACLRAVQEYASDEAMQLVKYVVADSPFCSFKMVATEQITKLTSLPEFLSAVMANAFAARIEEKYGIDLTKITLDRFNSPIPVTFFHSSQDEMMGPQHIRTITNGCTGCKEVCDIKMLHNQERPAWVILRAMGKIYAAIKDNSMGREVREVTNRKGLTIAKISSQKFLSVITPSGIDMKIRKSMKIIPFLKSQRKSMYREHTKENSLFQRPPRQTMDRLMKHSCIQPVTTAPIIRLGTPSNKSRKVVSNSFL